MKPTVSFFGTARFHHRKEKNELNFPQKRGFSIPLWSVKMQDSSYLWKQKSVESIILLSVLIEMKIESRIQQLRLDDWKATRNFWTIILY